MGLFGKKRKKAEETPGEKRAVTKELKKKKEVQNADPQFSVTCEITYMESDEVII